MYFISRHIHIAYINRCLVSVFICQFAAPRKMYIVYYAKKLLLAHGTYPETFETKLKLNNFKSNIIYNYNKTQKHLRNKSESSVYTTFERSGLGGGQKWSIVYFHYVNVYYNGFNVKSIFYTLYINGTAGNFLGKIQQETKLFTFALHEICKENSFAPGWGDNLNNRCGENPDLWFFPKNIFCLYTACT